ncbi:helix-turn-helix transcriptional regulator [Peribacillus frigoritolerans]|uniref:helix-turn-helix transcriptional regulator n=1 Tax=Peribacillus frigoritolerans TaxID=450367 RepID=UPI0038093C90
MQNKLEEIRKKFNYSQEKLAMEMNVSRQTIISIEKNRYNPSLPLALKMAKKFNLTVEDIFYLNSEDEK